MVCKFDFSASPRGVKFYNSINSIQPPVKFVADILGG
jgi:hypothetical protein